VIFHFKEEHRLRVFENGAEEKIWTREMKLQDATEIHSVYVIQNITIMKCLKRIAFSGGLLEAYCFHFVHFQIV
jgi:hypothetical protein